MHRLAKQANYIALVTFMLIAFMSAGSCPALEARPEKPASIGLLEVGSADLEGGLPIVQEMLSAGRLKVAARTVEAVYLYAKPGGITELKDHGVDARVLVEGLKRAGRRLDREGFVNAVESIRNYDLGIANTLSFSSSDHQGLERVYFTRFQNGKFVMMDW